MAECKKHQPGYWACAECAAELIVENQRLRERDKSGVSPEDWEQLNVLDGLQDEVKRLRVEIATSHARLDARKMGEATEMVWERIEYIDLDEIKRLREALERNRVRTLLDGEEPGDYCNECLKLMGKCAADCEVAKLLGD